MDPFFKSVDFALFIQAIKFGLCVYVIANIIRSSYVSDKKKFEKCVGTFWKCLGLVIFNILDVLLVSIRSRR